MRAGPVVNHTLQHANGIVSSLLEEPQAETRQEDQLLCSKRSCFLTFTQAYKHLVLSCFRHSVVVSILTLELVFLFLLVNCSSSFIFSLPPPSGNLKSHLSFIANSASVCMEQHKWVMRGTVGPDQKLLQKGCLLGSSDSFDATEES